MSDARPGFPGAAQLLALVDDTWPAAEMRQDGPWCLRRGGGGGKRVSAASPLGPVTGSDIPLAEAAMRALDQDLLFRLSPEDAALDALLDARGYAVVDPVNIYLCPTATLAALPLEGDRSAMAIWEPLAMQREIWARGGIGPARLAVMERVAGPRTSFLGRYENAPAGTAFTGIGDQMAMLHALEILPEMRGKGMGRAMMIEAARWALAQNAGFFAVVCTRGNLPANRLYSALGMEIVGHYHYRQTLT